MDAGKYKQTESFHLEAGRKPLNASQFRQVYQYQPVQDAPLSDRLVQQASCSRSALLRGFPLLSWLPRYRRQDLIHDVIAGVTVAVMHIPQGMAYALLGGVPPVVGIYMAFFPVLVYILMGTSRHVSMGTFAVISMMVGKSVAQHAQLPITTNATVVIEAVGRSPVEVATAVCFTVGAWQVVMSILKLGSLSVLLSDTLVSGFTTGAAVHVFTSQLKNLLGLSLKRYSGPFKLVYTYCDLFRDIGQSNFTAVTLSTCFLLALFAFNELVKPFLARRFKRSIPVPVELLVIIAGTLLSVAMDLEHGFHISVVREVPTGLPLPKIPPLDLLPDLLLDGLVIAVVAVSINLSMASIFAKKHQYDIDGNQEILASGVGNILSSFFSCMPFSASLSRSLVQEAVGGRTQITSFVSCILLVFVLLFIGPFFEPLPYCILSTIIVISLKGMFLQIKDFPRIMRLSKLDGMVWLLTFLSVVLLDIDYGLGIGLLVSIATMILRNQSPEVLVLGQVPDTDLFLDVARFKRARQPNNLLLLQIVGGLHFANCEATKKKILEQFLDFQNNQSIVLVTSEKPTKTLSLVISLSAVPFVDPSAIRSILAIQTELSKLQVKLVLCDCTPSVFEALDSCDIFHNFPKSLIFPTLHDAIEYLRKFDD